MIISQSNIQSRLNLDISSLWQPIENEHFIIRFKDLTNEKQSKLAERIKATSPIWSIRRAVGPSKEMIQETLETINPIIFAENPYYRNRDNVHKCFGSNEHYSITGWKYTQLNKALYRMLCIKNH